MGHYSSCYEQDAREELERRKAVIDPFIVRLEDLIKDIERSPYYNENSTVVERLREGLFWITYNNHLNGPVAQ